MVKMIITISGLAGAGKDTAADYMLKQFRNFGKKAIKLNFGDFPKMAVAAFFDVPVETLFGSTVDTEKKNRARHFLIAYAEGIKNFSGSDYWAQMMVDKINELEEYDVIIIPDLRFPAELHTLLTIPDRDLLCTEVVRKAVMPVDEDWLILGYHKGYLTGNQIYQYHNINPELNPLAYQNKDIVNTSFQNDNISVLYGGVLNFVQKRVPKKEWPESISNDSLHQSIEKINSQNHV